MDGKVDTPHLGGGGRPKVQGTETKGREVAWRVRAGGPLPGRGCQSAYSMDAPFEERAEPSPGSETGSESRKVEPPPGFDAKDRLPPMASTRRPATSSAGPAPPSVLDAPLEFPSGSRRPAGAAGETPMPW